jgi:16S rRNA (uracil1498-N3)-methyltransferase
MNLVYCPGAASGQLAELDDNEFHHLQVLRAQTGDSLHAFDGKGNLYSAILSNMAKKSATIHIVDIIRSEPEPRAKLHIAIAPTKNIERLELFLEKATEIGIHTITPLICQRSERRELRQDRLEKVILSAAKQSLHLYLPTLNNPMKISDFLKRHGDEQAKKMIAYCEEKTHHLKDNLIAGENIIVMIGPEGDFTDEEVNQAKAAGYTAISLGESRLRTETAGIMASAIFNIANP